ncbi:MAG TPA: hypothetical protein PLA41_02160 [Candidatus Pacearchaeota archaeon]|nr:hypothetical protein [Candidatus Pacearchaeota archaeon]HQI74456.1 hypothetical protein [Candidatus Pacearchaeota archaeon]
MPTTTQVKSLKVEIIYEADGHDGLGKYLRYEETIETTNREKAKQQALKNLTRRYFHDDKFKIIKVTVSKNDKTKKKQFKVLLPDGSVQYVYAFSEKQAKMVLALRLNGNNGILGSFNEDVNAANFTEIP